MCLSTRSTMAMSDWAIELLDAIGDRATEAAAFEHVFSPVRETRLVGGMLPRMSKRVQKPKLIYFDIRGRAEPS